MKQTIARSIALLLIFAITLLPPQSGFAQQGGQTNPHLLKNINPAESEGSSPLNFMPVGPVTYFFAKQGDGQYELWKTDGTPLGTTLVKDEMYPGLNSYAVLNNFLYYPAKDLEHGEELWRTNLATDETGLFADIDDEYSSGPSGLTEFEGKIYFSANWGRFQSTDGTTGGTTHNGLTGERVDSVFMEYQGSLYYSAYQWNPITDEDSVFLHWFGQGGSGVTYGLTPGKPLIIYKDRLYFTAGNVETGMELWSTGGTLESIKLLRDTHPGDTHIYYTAAVYNDLLYFVTVDDTNVNELWVTNGTEARTTKVTNLPEGATKLRIITALPSQSAESPGGLLLSINQGGDENHKLWRFDGTAFTMLADLRRFKPEDEFESEFGQVVGGVYYFHAWDANHGVELWRTDGTPAGTAMVKDIYPGVGDSMPSRFTLCGSRLCFAANDGVHGKELWAYEFVHMNVYLPGVSR